MTNSQDHGKGHLHSDILAGILALLETSKFVGDPEKIHTTIWRAKRHYPILNAFNFTVADVFPFSRDLEESLAILQRSRMIRMENPDYDTYVARKKLLKRILERFSPDEKMQLTDISAIFSAECGKIESYRDEGATPEPAAVTADKG